VQASFSGGLFELAQADCQVCLNQLMSRHGRLVPCIVRRQTLGKLSFTKAIHTRRMGLWRAILGYDSQKGYACTAIARHIWRAERTDPQSVEIVTFPTIDVDVVWRNCRLARELGMHLEITTLVIPGVNDQDEALHGIAARIVAELGADVPWHVSGHYPAYCFTARPTLVSALERAGRIGKEAGLAFVYVGNVLGHERENTYCPDCDSLLIERWGLSTTANRLEGGRCPRCDRE